MSPASFLWMADLNAEVRCRIGWLRGGGGRLTVVEVGEVGGRSSLLLMASSRLRTWVLGVRQIEQFCRASRCSGAGFGRLLAGSLDFSVDVEVECGVHFLRLGLVSLKCRNLEY